MKAHVLVVEDDAPLRRIIANNLEARGHTVRQAPDAQSALDALAEAPPDLLILDVNLPDLTGWDVLRKAVLPEHTRVLMLTAVPVSPRRLSEFRPVAYLPKPFPLDALLRLAESSARTVPSDD
ncbi:MAG: response regulator transcription factor [Chloroflexota bacterium]